ncbi:MAG: DUF5658 family protein [Deltaproteobacteria bacterium]|nr:DUF5658 family protein [Deltaproteobacteria bacterium]
MLTKESVAAKYNRNSSPRLICLWHDRTAVMTIPMGYRLPFFVLFILSCSILDYLFTVRHMTALGLRELNPIMYYLFTLGEYQAFLFKYFMTAGGLLLLCALSRHLRVNRLITGIAVLYTILTLYHVFLLRFA